MAFTIQKCHGAQTRQYGPPLFLGMKPALPKVQPATAVAGVVAGCWEERAEVSQGYTEKPGSSRAFQLGTRVSPHLRVSRWQWGFFLEIHSPLSAASVHTPSQLEV